MQNTYYPPIKPYAQHQLAVENPHALYIEECGNPNGLPILFVHGGPGAGCNEDQRRYFDPQFYHIILFDQRGCGRSTPHAELRGNNTQALIDDIEKIRHFLKIDRWILFGGSWGSTLSLLYAQAHPARVLALILRGIFLVRNSDLNWFYQHGASEIFPDYWADYIAPVPPEKRDNFIHAYHDIFTGTNDIAKMAAAKAWYIWEMRTINLLPKEVTVETAEDIRKAYAFSLIENHYFYNNCFIGSNQILNNCVAIMDIPTIIIHGRYDIVCPFDNAWQLHKALPNSELQIIADSGHAGNELGIINALVHATNRLRTTRY